MAEEFALSSLVIPGTYIRVRAEGLISAGGISTGNVGIVGTAEKGAGETLTLSDYRTAIEKLGRYSAYQDGAGANNLPRALELLFANGARTVYARALPDGDTDFGAQLEELIKHDVNIVIAPEMSTSDATTLLSSLVENQENNNKDLIAVVGSDSDEVGSAEADPATGILGDVTVNKRLIMTAPGIKTKETVVDDDGKVSRNDVTLKGRYTAAAVAGLLSTLVPQSSPTNKIMPGIGKLARRFSYGETKDLINGGVLVLEERLGVRVVRGVSTEMATGGPFQQITTRRIVDFAKAGIRRVANPFIGRLNNQRVRKALQGAIDGFLTTMLQDEALTNYSLEVTATRDDEIAGRAMVNALLQPTFSIDFIAVTLLLE
jgi:hypothetical protein